MEVLRSFQLVSTVIILVLLLSKFQNYEALGSSATCRPAEEGKDYTFSFNLMTSKKEIITRIVIEKDETPITKCLLPNNCTDYIRDYRTTLFVNETSKVITIIVRMHNVSRDRTYKNGIRFFVIYNFNISIFICKIIIFARIKSISCNTEMVDDSLHIICISSNIYHETQCDISIRYPGKKKNMVSTPSINNNRERSSSDQTVFKTVCSVFISKEDLFPGQYEAVVTMYPNITGTSDDKQFSTIHALSVNLEYPSITVKNCPEIIEENTEVTCTCERTDKSLIKFSLVWFDSSGKKTASSGSPYLKFIATRTINKGNPYFICQTESWFRWKNSNITIAYEPIIIVTVKNHTCKHQNLPHEVTVTCETELIYPAAKCHYTIYYNHLEYIHKSSQAMYYHNDIYQNTIHYKSTCVVNISKENLEPGQYNIKIYMYPNVTGNTSDTQFGSFTIISINIGSQSPFYLANRISLLTSLIAGCLGIFLTFIVICIHKYLKQRAAPRNLLDICVACTESKNISSNYDEINEGYILATHIDYQGHVRFDDNDEYRRIGDNIQKATQEIEMLEENDFYELIDDEIVAHKVNVEIIPTDQSFVCLNIVNIVNVESTHAVLNENDLNI